MNSLSSYVHKYSCKCTYLLTTLHVKEEEKLLKSLTEYTHKPYSWYSNRLERNFTGSDVPKSEKKEPTDEIRRE
jgi:hypothetical protein